MRSSFKAGGFSMDLSVDGLGDVWTLKHTMRMSLWHLRPEELNQLARVVAKAKAYRHKAKKVGSR